jgi:hypothetical protein
LIQLNKLGADDTARIFGSLDNVDELRDAVKLTHSIEGSADVLKLKSSTKIKEIVHDYRRFVDAGGDVKKIKNVSGYNIDIAKNNLKNKYPMNNIEEEYKNVNGREVRYLKGDNTPYIRMSDLNNFGDFQSLIIKNLNQMPNGTEIYRVTPNTPSLDGRTWFVLKKPRTQIEWEKFLAINRRQWHGVNPEDYNVYKFVKQQGDDLPYIEGVAASQDPWIQFPGGETQLLFEYKKIPEDRLIKSSFEIQGK